MGPHQQHQDQEAEAEHALEGGIDEKSRERLGEADLLWSRVSREPRATVALRPGQAAVRPGTETRSPNVVRAGTWIDTGWPATMESAVRSGRAAARALTAEKTTPIPA